MAWENKQKQAPQEAGQRTPVLPGRQLSLRWLQGGRAPSGREALQEMVLKTEIPDTHCPAGLTAQVCSTNTGSPGNRAKHKLESVFSPQNSSPQVPTDPPG